MKVRLRSMTKEEENKILEELEKHGLEVQELMVELESQLHRATEVMEMQHNIINQQSEIIAKLENDLKLSNNRVLH